MSTPTEQHHTNEEQGVVAMAALLDYPAEQQDILRDGVARFGETIAKAVPASAEPSTDTVRTATEMSASAVAVVLETLQRASPVFHELPSPRRETIAHALGDVLEIMAGEAFQRDVSGAALEARTQAAVDTFRLFTFSDAHRLQRVIDALDPDGSEGAEAISVEEAEVRGRLRLQALYQKIVGESLSVAELAKWRLSRQRLKQLRDEDHLFAISVPYHRSMLYPAWQFDSRNRPRESMPGLIAAARESGIDPIGLHQTMTNPAAGGGVPLTAWLDQGRGEDVVEVIRAIDA
jgi:hypothetical protein